MSNSISNLTSLSALAAGDQIPVGSTSAGMDVRVALSVLVAYIQTLLTAPGDLTTQYFAPNATAWSVTVAPPNDGDSIWLLISPAAAYADGTIVLPPVAECHDMQLVEVSCTQDVTNLVIDGNGTSVYNPPTTIAAPATHTFAFRFDGVSKAWYRAD